MVDAKDVLRALPDVGNDFARVDIMKVASKPWFVPDTTPLPEQLNAFLRRKAHIAIVVDEYGEVEGLVTLEDIIEEIVGEIADEHDIDVQGVRQQPDGSVLVDGSVPIRDLNRALDWTLPDDEAVTVAGLVINELGHLPAVGEEITFRGLRFKVVEADERRVSRVRIHKPTKAPDEKADVAEASAAARETVISSRSSLRRSSRACPSGASAAPGGATQTTISPFTLSLSA